MQTSVSETATSKYRGLGISGQKCGDSQGVNINYRNGGLLQLTSQFCRKKLFGRNLQPEALCFEIVTGTAGFLIGTIFCLGLFRQHPVHWSHSFSLFCSVVPLS